MMHRTIIRHWVLLSYAAAVTCVAVLAAVLQAAIQ